MVQGALAGGDEAESARQEAAARRAASEGCCASAPPTSKREGDLPESADPTDLARYVKTITHGMAVQSASGASPDQRRRVAQPRCARGRSVNCQRKISRDSAADLFRSNGIAGNDLGPRPWIDGCLRKGYLRCPEK